MRVKTSELTGHALGWSVAVAEGLKPLFTRQWITPANEEDPRRVCVVVTNRVPSFPNPYEPWRDWWQGGPIIEREAISLDWAYRMEWGARIYLSDEEPWALVGPTPLVAAMRCYVASRLGDEVEIPEELLA